MKGSLKDWVDLISEVEEYKLRFRKLLIKENCRNCNKWPVCIINIIFDNGFFSNILYRIKCIINEWHMGLCAEDFYIKDIKELIKKIFYGREDN